MKQKCVELSQFECELIVAFARQPKTAPVSTSLCRVIFRRLEGKPAFARTTVEVHEKSSVTVHPVAAEK